MSDVPAELARLATLVDAALPAAIEPAMSRVRALHPSLDPWAGELDGMIAAGGKRLRPALLLLGHAAAGGIDEQTVLPAGLALELLHTCALLHDDLLDDADARRGRTTAHVSFAAVHRESGLAGDAERYGAAAAVLVGDLAFVVADELFLACDVPADRLLAGLRAFTGLREEVMAGQALDVQAAAARLTSRELALTIAAAKSGRYSVARPLQIGALLAGATAAAADALAAAVEPLGQAFQVRDDLLGVFGDQGTTGKSAAGDLREGKRTLLVAEAAARLDDAGRARLEELLGDPSLTDEQVEEARTLLASSGAVAATHAWIDDAVERGLAAVEALDLAPHARRTLHEVGAWLVGRQA
ncbi:MAG: geranylgeranyl diphosphate synthase type I [Nitriliruptoraceae bacterium]|jgi:geranylgeranyl diphosphate synthase type I